MKHLDYRIPLIQKCIKSDFRGFLQSLSTADFADTCAMLYLSEAEKGLFETLYSQASKLGAEDFQKALNEYRSAHPDCWPIELIPSAKGYAESKSGFDQALRAKRVALVGPSHSIIGSGLGEQIDAFDVVVRMNYQWPVSTAELQADIGKRLDVLYHSCNGDYALDSILTPALGDCLAIGFVPNLQARALLRYCETLQIPAMHLGELMTALEKELNSVPNTGLLAIRHLLSTPLRTLSLFGISFFQEPYYPGYQGKGAAEQHWSEGRPSSIDQHNIEAQLHYFETIYAQEPRLQLDEVLTTILRQRKENSK